MSVISRIVAVGLPLAIIGVLGIGGVMVMQANAPEAEKAEEAVRGLAVFTEPLESASIRLDVRSQGEVHPRREIAISSQIAGRVDYINDNFIEGGFIPKGDILIRIENADYELGVVRARSAVASAEQRLAREQAESDLARQDLEELGITSPSPLALREPQLAEARASLDGAKASLRDAELALARTVVRAPFTARIRTKMVDLGQFVSPGQSLGMMFGVETAQVSLPLTDTELGRLGLPLAFNETTDNPGPKVIFYADVAGMPRQWEGRIRRTAAAVDSRTRLVSAIAEVDDPFGEGADDGAPLAPGLFVDAVIEGLERDGLIRANRDSVRGAGRLFIADKETSTLSIRQVNVIYSEGDSVYFAEGAEPGELGVTSPLQTPVDGMSITIAGLEEDE